jgi:hypothetical protein
MALPLTSAAERWPSREFTVDVLIDGRPARVYHAGGTAYIEAVKGKDYAIRLRNPLPVRVAVALSVDGLSTIDARRSSASEARKWVLDPYETVTISGWQTSLSEARRFYFTSEEQSYARWLGKTENIGVISAVFFRERLRQPIPITRPQNEAPAPTGPVLGWPGQSSSAPAPPSEPKDQSKAERAARAVPAAEADEYAATGIGRPTDHRVRRVYLDLEPTPVASVNLRYEYRAQLTRLGILPDVPDRLARRQKARGFDGFCPVPPER